MDSSSPPRPPLATRRRAGRLLAGAVSVGLHASLLLLVLFSLPKPQPLPPPPIVVQIVAEEAPAPKPPAPAPPAPKPAPTPPAKSRSKSASAVAHAATPRPAVASRVRRANATTSPLSASDSDAPDESLVSDAELAGARGAGSGGGGGGGACDMVGRVQAALRKDGVVRSAVTSFAGRAVRVWNGDWVRSLGEDGKGLAAVREAVMWEIAFAPAACKTEPVRGLIVVSVDSPEGRVRLALGTSAWRWSDLLASREAALRP